MRQARDRGHILTELQVTLTVDMPKGVSLPFQCRSCSDILHHCVHCFFRISNTGNGAGAADMVQSDLHYPKEQKV